jgi:hypothetical protein
MHSIRRTDVPSRERIYQNLSLTWHAHAKFCESPKLHRCSTGAAMDFQGKTVLITGANNPVGIGAAPACAFAKAPSWL